VQYPGIEVINYWKYPMKNLLKMAVLATSLFAGSAFAAPIANGPVDADAFVTFKGYDLAWASPCGSGLFGSSCSAIDMTVQAAYGWKVMTFDLFQSLGFDYSVFEVNYSSGNTQNYNGKNYAKASKWFNGTYSHIDVVNGEQGAWSFADVNNSDDWYFETMVYRTDAVTSSVPTPAPIALLGLGLLGLVLRRKAK
jgi:MYXO-CTERM domain-containing protein